jgi:mRNA-degrading endonuclease toxin of MazEF toxin-antitoxin module
VIVIPLTTTPRHYPTVIELEDTLPRPRDLQCEQIRALSRSRIGDWIATVDAVILSHVNLVLRRLLDLDEGVSSWPWVS